MNEEAQRLATEEKDEWLCGDSRIYSDLAQKVKKCTKCDLGCDGLVDGHDPHVMGQGSLESGVMFIAEAPGLQETIHDQPLTSTGASGKMYEKILNALGLNRDKVYTTNTVLCRPPKNRDPEPWEVRKCRGYLEQQLKLVNPKIVVTFGRFAAQVLLGSFKITKEHGQLRESTQFGVKVFPLYHPSYVRRSGQNRIEEFKIDVKNLKKILDELE